MNEQPRKKLTVQVGPLQVDVPRTVGYYGGVGAALALGAIDLPIAAFIAGIPLVKLLADRRHGWRVDFAVQLFEGASKPVGGDSEGTVQLGGNPKQLESQSS